MSFPIIEALASFTTGTRYEDVPPPIIRQSRNVLLDSIGCALGGTTTDPGKAAISIAARLGGAPECSILGTGERVSITNAVLANGQLVNALDFDTVMPGGHTPPYIVPTVLAMAERQGASGKDLILATAIGLELSARIAKAVPPAMSFDDESGEFGYAKREGYARLNFGAAGGASRLFGLDSEQTVNALAHAGHMSQLNTWSRGNYSLPRNLAKYGYPGWQNTGAVLSVFFAEAGILGDIGLLDDAEHGYGEFSGYEGWHPERILPGLGETWSFEEVRYKPYACCTMLHRAIECFEEILRTHRPHPEEIESVTVYASPTVEASLFQDRALNNIVDLQFGTHNMFAMTAYGERTGVDWQDWNKLTDPKIVAFTEKVTLRPHPDFAESETSRVEVVVGDQTFAYELPGYTAPLDEDQLFEKFRHNAVRSLTQPQIDRAVDHFENLADLEDVATLMATLTA